MSLSTQLFHGIRATTTTSGTGSITLVADASYMLPLARLTAGKLLSYSLLDGTSREWGVGTVNAANVFARTTITGTEAAGVYTSGGTALSLSGGTTYFECTLHEGTLIALGVSLIAITQYTVWGTYAYAKGTNNPVYLEVELVGGGGNQGGAGSFPTGWAHGGGGGGYAKKKILASALGASETVIVGGAGRGSSGAGSVSSFGTAPFLSGDGGTAGGNGGTTGGAGGLGHNGDIIVQGGWGAYSSTGDYVLGGSTFFGGPGPFNNTLQGAYGTGGSGSAGVTESGNDGVVNVYEYG